MSKTFRTKRDAQDWARQAEDEMVRGVFVNRASSHRPVPCPCDRSLPFRNYADETSQYRHAGRAGSAQHGVYPRCEASADGVVGVSVMGLTGMTGFTAPVLYLVTAPASFLAAAWMNRVANSFPRDSWPRTLQRRRIQRVGQSPRCVRETTTFQYLLTAVADGQRP